MHGTQIYTLTNEQREFLIRFNKYFNHSWTANLARALETGEYSAYQKILFNSFGTEYTEWISMAREALLDRPNTKWNVRIKVPTNLTKL